MVTSPVHVQHQQIQTGCTVWRLVHEVLDIIYKEGVDVHSWLSDQTWLRKMVSLNTICYKFKNKVEKRNISRTFNDAFSLAQVDQAHLEEDVSHVVGEYLAVCVLYEEDVVDLRMTKSESTWREQLLAIQKQIDNLSGGLELRHLPASCGGPFGAGRWIDGRVVLAVAVRQRSQLEVVHELWREDRVHVLSERKMIGLSNVDTSRFQVQAFVVPVRINRRQCVRMLVVSTKQQSGDRRNSWREISIRIITPD